MLLRRSTSLLALAVIKVLNRFFLSFWLYEPRYLQDFQVFQVFHGSWDILAIDTKLRYF